MPTLFVNLSQVALTEDWRSGGFGLYLHWPYCQAKCPYCDFNSHVTRNIDHSRWNRAYLSEISRYAALLPERVLNSVYFGGGTPSLMAPETVASVIEAIKTAWPTANDLEITLEANPGSVEAERFKAYADAGVNRISMGFQALNDADLRRLGRMHTVSEALQAYEIARKYFSRVNFDLIYARQDQTLVAWEAELSQALGLAADHLSLYQLTIESGTAFGDRYARGKLPGLPQEDLATDMFILTQEMCKAAGLPAYEISNHARPGSESRHNLIYWRYGDYVGIGPGAHGRVTLKGQRYATEGWSMPERWLTGVPEGSAEKPWVPLSGAIQASEYLMMGLRTLEGIDLDRHARLSGAEIPKDRLQHLEDIGMIRYRDRNLRTTDNGRRVLNAVIETLLP